MDHHQEDPIKVKNIRHQHAFVVVGEETLFGVHMTQYHCELHKYQIIIKFSLEDKVKEELLKMREVYPTDTFWLCNGKDQEGEISLIPREFSVPELAGGSVKKFIGDIFQGIRNPTGDEGSKPHFFPWSRDRVRPAIENVEVTVERIQLFRPFAHHHQLPPYGTYWIFGEGKEAHMTNLQTAHLATSPFEPPAFGPDYDHVMSLQEAPDWLDQPMLVAGIEVTTPKIILVDPETGKPNIPCKPPVFEPGESVEVLYRGINEIEGLRVKAGYTFLQCVAVCNGPEGSISTHKVMPPCKNEECCMISEMPKKYWVT